MNVKDLSSGNVTLGEITTYEAGILQASAYRVLKKFTDGCLKEYNLTSMQWFMIGVIHDAGPAGLRISRLRTIMDTNLPYITNALNVLESRAIVERIETPDDARGRYVCLTEGFGSKFDAIETSLRHSMREGIYNRINPEQLRTYILVLQQLNRLGAET